MPTNITIRIVLTLSSPLFQPVCHSSIWRSCVEDW